MQNINALADIYVNILNADNTQTVQKYEQLLLDMQAQPLFCNLNLAFIYQPWLEYRMRKLAVVEFDKYACNLLQARNFEKISNQLQLMLKYVKSQKLQHQLKDSLLKTMSRLLSVSQTANIRQKLIQEVNKMMDLNAQQLPKVNFLYYGQLIQVVLSLNQHKSEVTNFIKVHSVTFTARACQLNLKIMQGEANQPNELINLYQTAANYARVIKKMLEKINSLEIIINQIDLFASLADVVSTGFKINHPSNAVDTSLFMVHENQDLALAFNQFKITYFEFLQFFLRTKISYLKVIPSIQENPLVKCTFQLLEYIIVTLSRVLDSQSSFGWSVQSKLDEAIYQLLKILNSALIMPSVYYSLFERYKVDIYQKIIFRCLMLSSSQIVLFDQNPSQFAQRALVINNRQTQNTAEDQEQQQLDSLKQLAADCLLKLCTMQDGTASHFYEYSLSCLQGKIESSYPFYLLYQALAILKDCLKKNSEIRVGLVKYIQSQCHTKLFYKNESIQFKVNYFYLLIMTSKIVQTEDLKYEQALSLIKQAQEALNSGCEAWQFGAYETLQALGDKTQSDTICYQIIHLYHKIMEKRKPTYKLLIAYHSHLDRKIKFLIHEQDTLVIGIELIRDELSREITREQIDRHFIQLCFNILSCLGEKYYRIPSIIDQVQTSMLPLAQFCFKKDDFDFQDEMFSLLTSFIKLRKRISPAQFKVISIIPNIYFKQYKECFGETFQTLHLFIFYGIQFIQTSDLFRNSLVIMTIKTIEKTNMTKALQVNSCAGALLLQSLLIALYQKLPPFLLSMIFEALMKKLDICNGNNFLIVNLLGLLALTLPQIVGNIDEQQGTYALTKILMNGQRFKQVEYASKVMVVGMSQLLLKANQNLVVNYFTQIFAAIIEILSHELTKGESLIDEHAEQQYKEYIELDQKVTNRLKDIDVFQFFQKIFEKLRNQHSPVLGKAINWLSQLDRKILSQILRTSRVEKTFRIIYKPK